MPQPARTAKSQVTGHVSSSEAVQGQAGEGQHGRLPKLQQRFNVMAIPTLMVLRRGQVAARRAGAVPAASLRA
jgi:hypothetical protein